MFKGVSYVVRENVNNLFCKPCDTGGNLLVCVRLCF